MADNQNYALHACIIKKPISKEEAIALSKDFIKAPNKKYFRETNSSFRFRNVPKQKFTPKTFRTKRINNQISLIYGELKPEHAHLSGSGIGDWLRKGKQLITGAISKVKEQFTARSNLNNSSQQTVNEWGNKPILKLTIYRTPINKLIDTAFNFISLGKWEPLKRKFGIDKLFHLALIADVGGKNIIIEKNEVINIGSSYSTSKDTETKEIPLNGKQFTINEMLETAKARVGDEAFYKYDPFTNNCQVFIKMCLESEGLYTEDAKAFLFQDVSEIYKRLPSYVTKFSRGLTDVGAVANRITGQGIGRETIGGSRASAIMAAIAAKDKVSPGTLKIEKVENASKGLISQASKSFYDFILTKNIKPNHRLLYIKNLYEEWKNPEAEREETAEDRYAAFIKEENNDIGDLAAQHKAYKDFKKANKASRLMGKGIQELYLKARKKLKIELKTIKAKVDKIYADIQSIIESHSLNDIKGSVKEDYLENMQHFVRQSFMISALTDAMQKYVKSDKDIAFSDIANMKNHFYEDTYDEMATDTIKTLSELKSHTKTDLLAKFKALYDTFINELTDAKKFFNRANNKYNGFTKGAEVINDIEGAEETKASEPEPPKKRGRPSKKPPQTAEDRVREARKKDLVDFIINIKKIADEYVPVVKEETDAVYNAKYRKREAKEKDERKKAAIKEDPSDPGFMDTFTKNKMVETLKANYTMPELKELGIKISAKKLDLAQACTNLKLQHLFY
jgi:virulence-associated protein VapD